MIQFIYESDKELFEHAIGFAQKQVKRLVESYPGFLPDVHGRGQVEARRPAWTHWCDGFLPGMMWIFYKHLGPDKPESKFWLEKAIHYSKPLEERKMDRDVHDLGFIFLSTYYRWYQITRDNAVREVVLQAGRTLAHRYNETGQYLRSFVAEDSIFIDIMMNVGIIFYTARECNDKRLRDIAVTALHYDAAFSGSWRWVDRARRHFRSRDGRIFASDDAARLSRRFLLVAGLGLGVVRILNLLRIQP